MDRSEISAISYRWHSVCNPFSLEQLERTLAFADLKPGDRAADLGCGNGFVSSWMAARYGLDLTAVEQYPQVAEIARQTAAQSRAQGKVEVIEGSAAAYLAVAGEHRLVSLFGANDLLPGVNRPTDVMAALVPNIAPGGWLIWGDLFWKTPPGPRTSFLYPPENFATLTGWIAAGEQAGLTPYYAAVSADAEWEQFVWRMSASLEAWADDHAGSPEGEAIRQRAAGVRALYLEEGRDGVGFGLFLFRRPPA